MTDRFRLADDDDEEGKEGKSHIGSKVSSLLLENRTVLLFGEISMKSVLPIVAQLLALDGAGSDPIRLFINSPGGHVEAGDTLFDVIQFVRSPIKVVGTGWVASAGNHVFLAADKENRFCLPNTRFLIHQPMGSVRGQALDVEIEAREMLLMKKRLNRIIAERTGQSLERVQADTERNYWMNAEQAIEYGIVHKVVTSIDEV